MLDTSNFDKAITDLNSQLIIVQTDLDNDPYNIQKLAYESKVANVRLIQDKLSTVNLQKLQAIELQDKLDSIDATKVELAQQITDIQAAIPK